MTPREEFEYDLNKLLRANEKSVCPPDSQQDYNGKCHVLGISFIQKWAPKIKELDKDASRA